MPAAMPTSVGVRRARRWVKIGEGLTPLTFLHTECSFILVVRNYDKATLVLLLTNRVYSSRATFVKMIRLRSQGIAPKLREIILPM